MKSIWSDTAALPSFETLNEDISTDVLIIGGGIAGILCAYMLDKAGVNYTLVEASTICSGISKNTTAKITSQHGLIFHKMVKRFGIENAHLYIEANETALHEYAKLCQSIDCGFEWKDSYVYALDDPKKLEKEMDALNQIGYPADFVTELPLPFTTAGAVCFPEQAQFHPLQFLAHIAKDLHIYEHTMVKELSDNLAFTDHCKIRADKMIVTTHFPLLRWRGSYFLKMYQDRSYVIALENAPNVDGMFVDEAEKGMSFRNYQDLLFIGGGDHRTGKKGGNWAELQEFAKKYYPNAREVARWATQDCMTLDEIPYIGQYAPSTPNLYAATGFNKWGMTSSMVAATMLRDMILGKNNPYTELFSPSRSILRPQLLVNGFEAVTNLLTPTLKRCPHMGCALKWNPQEHSWDCPCHGSRFEEDGKLIDSPAAHDIKKFDLN